MRLGIPGSTRMLLPEQCSASHQNRCDDTMNCARASANGGIALATVHMLQHFRMSVGRLGFVGTP